MTEPDPAGSGPGAPDWTQLQRLVGSSVRALATGVLDLGPVLPAVAEGAGQGPQGGFALAQGRIHEVCGPARRVMVAWVIAALQAQAGREAPVLWLRPRWQAGGLFPHGLAAIADPRAVITVNCPREEDLLWCMEEALRTGAAPLIIVELPRPPGLTPVRRLQLAAEAGSARMDADGRGPRMAPGGRAPGMGADGGGGGVPNDPGAPRGLEAQRGHDAPIGHSGVVGQHVSVASCASLAICAPTGLIISSGDGGAAGVESRWFAAPLWRGGQPAWQLERRRARMAPPATWVLVEERRKRMLTGVDG
ncbi:ImuA family protein [Roseicitreum antarcticum]|uniref:ImuA family protein n=1 Tax=Roseicitreum antarcticum TaxID=564137 RepID=UPI000B83C2EA|nr:hypothetical protein [Roseicitreum antarcticum]